MKNKFVIIAAVSVGIAIVGGLAVFLIQDIQLTGDRLAISKVGLANELQNNKVLVIDIRDANSYMVGHIPGSAVDSLEEKTLDKRIKTIHSRIPEVASSYKFVLVDEDGSKSRYTAQIMSEADLVTYYLEGGINVWKEELSTKKTSIIISSDKLYSEIQSNSDLYLLDVRQPEELEVTMISNSINIPLADIFVPEMISEIPRDKPVVVICKTDNRATIATYGLAKYGIDFQVLEGGIKAWDLYLEENQLEKI